MGDAIKIAVKVGLVAVVTAAIVVIFATIKVPALDYSSFTNGLGTALAMFYYFVPIANILMPVVFIAVGIIVAIKLFEISMVGIRWIFKVNE